MLVFLNYIRIFSFVVNFIWIQFIPFWNILLKIVYLKNLYVCNIRENTLSLSI